MDDSTFLAAFEAVTIANEHFHHRDHLRLAWLYLRRDGAVRGADNITTGIRHFATIHGAAHRYHETLTRFWARVVEIHIRLDPTIDSFDDFMNRYPQLATKDLFKRHYTHETLFSDAAKTGWVEPDLRPFPPMS